MPLRYPEIETLFPANTRFAIVWFWIKYWFWFFLLLPWMLLRQAGLMFYQLCGSLWTWNRDARLLDGRIVIRFLNNLPSLAVTVVFGERFTCLQFEDVLIDPGPVFAKRMLPRRLAGTTIHAIVATHAHEEHIGNAEDAAHITGAPIYGTAVTLAAIRTPERISAPRKFFIGQPQASGSAELHVLGPSLSTSRCELRTIVSPGHCEGHASLFENIEGVLIAGDSFLHTIFTSPNREVRADEWIKTLDDYLQLPIQTMLGAHGVVYSVDPRIRPRPFIVRHTAPLEMIRQKREFLIWARDVVAEGEKRELPYSVIEACLFPWQRWWSWRNWFVDEGGRLFSAGEFSRTYFVRSLSRTPERVPPRFPPFARAVGLVRRLWDARHSG